MGKDFPRRLEDALPKRARRARPGLQPQMSEDEIFRNLDRHLNRIDAAQKRRGGRPPQPQP